MKPTISGMLERWQGLRTTLSIPHTAAAVSATAGAPSIARENVAKSCSTLLDSQLGQFDLDRGFVPVAYGTADFLAVLVEVDHERDRALAVV